MSQIVVAFLSCWSVSCLCLETRWIFLQPTTGVNKGISFFSGYKQSEIGLWNIQGQSLSANVDRCWYPPSTYSTIKTFGKHTSNHTGTASKPPSENPARLNHSVYVGVMSMTFLEFKSKLNTVDIYVLWIY